MANMAPFFKNVQSHYDLSDDFFALFLDPTLTYSCAYFEPETLTLQEAQIAKIDLSLGKLGLEPGMTLLDVGCGWGTAMIRAREKYGVNVVGLTLSEHQHARVSDRMAALTGPLRAEVRLQGWEDFDEPVDRIVSIGAFEHFRRTRHSAFFDKALKLLPADGVMLLHTIAAYSRDDLAAKQIPIGRSDALFARFMLREIFPGGDLVQPETVATTAEQSGFTVERIHSLQKHYARTLEIWTSNLEAKRSEAIDIADEETYLRYVKYLSGCADLFRRGTIDVMQYTLTRG